MRSTLNLNSVRPKAFFLLTASKLMCLAFSRFRKLFCYLPQRPQTPCTHLSMSSSMVKLKTQNQNFYGFLKISPPTEKSTLLIFFISSFTPLCSFWHPGHLQICFRAADGICSCRVTFNFWWHFKKFAINLFLSLSLSVLHFFTSHFPSTSITHLLLSLWISLSVSSRGLEVEGQAKVSFSKTLTSAKSLWIRSEMLI